MIQYNLSIYLTTFISWSIPTTSIFFKICNAGSRSLTSQPASDRQLFRTEIFTQKMKRQIIRLATRSRSVLPVSVIGQRAGGLAMVKSRSMYSTVYGVLHSYYCFKMKCIYWLTNTPQISVTIIVVIIIPKKRKTKWPQGPSCILPLPPQT